MDDDNGNGSFYLLIFYLGAGAGSVVVRTIGVSSAPRGVWVSSEIRTDS